MTTLNRITRRLEGWRIVAEAVALIVVAVVLFPVALLWSDPLAAHLERLKERTDDLIAEHKADKEGA